MKFSRRRPLQFVAAIVLVGLLSAFGFQGSQFAGASAAGTESRSAAAAAKPPKPSNTPRATNTPKPTKTPTSTPTETPTSGPCTVHASISPASGQKLPGTLTIVASDTNICAPDASQYSYVWTCDSFTVPDKCLAFLGQANVAPSGVPSATIYLEPNQDFDISVTMCLLGTPNCATSYAQYLGAEVGP